MHVCCWCVLSLAESEPKESSSDDRRSSVEATQSPQLLSSVQNLLNVVERKKSKSLDRVRLCLWTCVAHIMKFGLTNSLFVYCTCSCFASIRSWAL